MKTVAEIQRLIEETKQAIGENQPTQEKGALNDKLKRAYEERNLEQAVVLILSGANPDVNLLNSPSRRLSLLLRAAMDGEQEFVYAIAVLGGDPNGAITHSTENFSKPLKNERDRFKDLEHFVSTLKLLFDCGALGCEIESQNVPFDNLQFLFDRLAKAGVDFQGFNFIGFFHHGKPLTEEMLHAHGIEYQDGAGLFIGADLMTIENSFRKEAMESYLNISGIDPNKNEEKSDDEYDADEAEIMQHKFF